MVFHFTLDGINTLCGRDIIKHKFGKEMVTLEKDVDCNICLKSLELKRKNLLPKLHMNQSKYK